MCHAQKSGLHVSRWQERTRAWSKPNLNSAVTQMDTMLYLADVCMMAKHSTELHQNIWHLVGAWNCHLFPSWMVEVDFSTGLYLDFVVIQGIRPSTSMIVSGSVRLSELPELSEKGPGRRRFCLAFRVQVVDCIDLQC